MRRRHPDTLTLSARGLHLIASFEGLRLRAYKAHPSERFWTIGYGHYGPDVRPGDTITKARALALLRRDVREAERAVRALGVPMTQGEFDATVSFVFNLGPGVLADDRTFGRALRRRRYRRAANAMLLYVFAGGRRLVGLVRRRRAERRLFLSGVR